MVKKWTDLPQDKMLEFVSAVFSNDVVCEEVMCSVLNNEENSKCIFHPLRGKRMVCENEVCYPYGYCEKHANTIQAASAKKKWDAMCKEEQTENKPKVIPVSEDNNKKQPIESLEKQSSLQEEETVETEFPESSETSPLPKKRVAKIVRNKWGYYEHPESNIVFNP